MVSTELYLNKMIVEYNLPQHPRSLELQDGRLLEVQLRVATVVGATNHYHLVLSSPP